MPLQKELKPLMGREYMEYLEANAKVVAKWPSWRSGLIEPQREAAPTPQSVTKKLKHKSVGSGR